jgi:hypothetical protein
VDGLEVGENLDLQHRLWRFERAGFLAMALIVVVAVLGLFGPGLLGPARASSGALSIEYPRFARAKSPFCLRVRLSPADATRGHEVRLSISAQYLSYMSVERVTPQPKSVVLGSERVTFAFARDGTSGPVDLAFDLKARSCCAVRGTIGLADTTVGLQQLVYP